MSLNPRGTFSVDLSLFGSRVNDIQASDVPAGISPDNENVWFQPGMTATRPKFTRVLSPLSGNPNIVSVKEFISPTSDLLTAFVDSNGAIWLNDPETPSVNSLIGQVVAGLTAKWENAFNKLWGAFYSPLVSAAFSDSPFVGAGVPIYYNGENINRVTSDAPGLTPSFVNVPTVQEALTGIVIGVSGGSLTISAATVGTPVQVWVPGHYSGTPPRIFWIPGYYQTYYTTITYTATASVPANWLGLSETVTGITGMYASLFNVTGTITAVSGSTFTISAYTMTNGSTTGQSATATIGAGSSSTIYMQRTGNIVTVWLGGTSLPTFFQRGFWASTLNSGGGLINGPNWTITSISRDTTGLVTVTVSSQLQNLPVGTELFLTPGNTALSGTVSVTNGDPTVAWVSGSQFIDDMVGQAITINSVTYTVLAVSSPTSLTLASNVTSSTGTYSYSASINAFPAGLQTVFQVTNSTSSSTTFTYQSSDTSVASASSGTVYQQWSPQLGTNGNAAQIINTGVDTNNGAFFQFFQLGPDTSISSGQGNISSPYSQIAGQIPAGLRNVVMTFQSQDDAETAPSPITQIAVTGGYYLLQANNIPIGPLGTVSRNFAFTPFEGSSWYEIAPSVVPAIGNAGETIALGTLVQDNVSISAVIDFSDSQLTSATQIDEPGNDLFNQIVLPPCLGVIEYAERLHWWGAINNVRNFVNMGFDGGYLPIMGSASTTNGSPTVNWVSGQQFNLIDAGDVIYIGGTAYTVLTVPSNIQLTLTANFAGTSGTYPFNAIAIGQQVPLGWTQYGSGAPSLLAALGSGFGAENGFICEFTSTSGMSQPAYQDEFGAPIILPNTLYGVRFMAQAVGTGTGGTFTVSLISPSAGTLASATFSDSAMPTAAPGWVYMQMNGPTPNSIPADTLLVLQSALTGGPLEIDELEIIYANQPIQNQSTISSYIEDPFGYDDLTGSIAIDSPHSITAMFQQRGYCYLITDDPLFKTQVNAQSEPEGWTVEQYAAACGCSGPNAVDAGEDIAWWTGRFGGRLFNGNPSTKKMTQEIAPDWENHNWDMQTLDWVANDPVQRLVYCGIVQQGKSAVSAILPMNYRLADDAYNVPDPVHVSTYSGKMIATDLGRKWSLWTPGMNSAAMCTRNGPNGLSRQMVFAGSGFGNLYTLDTVNFPGLEDTDDDYGVIGGYYDTYYFPDHATEQNPIVGSYRKMFPYLGVHATGKGQLVLTPFVDSPTNPWPSFPAFNLTGVDPGFDYQIPLNVRGDRMSIRVATQALDGTPGGCFVLTHLIFSGQKDMSFPVRGALV